MVIKIFQKLVNNRLLDLLKKCGLFYDFQYSLRCSQSTADLFTFLSERIVRAVNRYVATQAIAFDISKVFKRV